MFWDLSLSHRNAMLAECIWLLVDLGKKTLLAKSGKLKSPLGKVQQFLAQLLVCSWCVLVFIYCCRKSNGTSWLKTFCLLLSAGGRAASHFISLLQVYVSSPFISCYIFFAHSSKWTLRDSSSSVVDMFAVFTQLLQFDWSIISVIVCVYFCPTLCCSSCNLHASMLALAGPSP